jgi:hypothetical protein
MTSPENPNPITIGVTDPHRDHRHAWRGLLAVALLPHTLLFLFMLRYWAIEADPGYLAIFAWFELLLAPGGLILGTILAAVRSTRRLAPAVFAGTGIGLLLVLAMVVLIDATT